MTELLNFLVILKQIRSMVEKNSLQWKINTMKTAGKTAKRKQEEQPFLIMPKQNDCV